MRGWVYSEWDGFDAGLKSVDGFDNNAAKAVTMLSYEVCLGTTPYGCQLQDFQPVALSTSWTSSADVQLQCGAVHYVAVRATNCAGLQRTVASAGATMCESCPLSGYCQEEGASSLRQVFVL